MTVMEHMDRQYQRELLARLASAYPQALTAEQLGASSDDRKLLFNATYLCGHGLIDARLAESMGGNSDALLLATVTHKGLDFLQDDGGLGAILGVVTVRFDAESLRALVAARIDASDLPTEEKSRVMAWLKSAGSEALKTATQRLVEAALDRAPEAIRLLPTLIG